MDILVVDTSNNLDLSRKLGISKAEFVHALERIDGSVDPIFLHARKSMASAVGPREHARAIEAAWQAARFRDLVRNEEISVRPGAVISAAQRIRAGLVSDASSFSYALPAIAMLALLQADSSDIGIRSRRESRSDRKSPAPRSGSGEVRGSASGLRVVTLNLADRGLQRLYDSSGMPKKAGQGVEEPDPANRVRHPVRGHLFLARNNKMTWRRPHWRGSLEQATIHRVTAGGRTRSP